MMPRILLGHGCVWLTLLVGSMPGREGLAAEGPARERPGATLRHGSSDGLRLAQGKVVRKKARGKRAMPKKGEAQDAALGTTQAPAAAGDSDLKFSRDIAPILVGNCIGCHNAKLRRGKFDMTSFKKLMEGAAKEKVVIPGKPDESPLVLRIKGEEKPKMPPGANRNLADVAIGKIERWVQAGAQLDAGIDENASLASIASTPQQLRNAELARMTPEARDQHVEKVGRDRWKKVSSKTTPEVTPGAHFLLFGNLPKERASAALKGMEGQYTQLRNLLSAPNSPALDWVEKVSLYVFNDRNSFVEFVRGIENREVDPEDRSTSDLKGFEPYVAVIDPHGGREEPAGSSPRKTARSKRDDSAAGTSRSLGGVLAEQFAIGCLKQAGDPPRWLTLGLGAYQASHVEPRNPYFQGLRRRAFDLCERGWTTLAPEALGGEGNSDDIRAVGFALIECMASTARPALPAFVRGMLSGQAKLDDVIQSVLMWDRSQFLEASREWVGMRYGSLR